MEIISITKQQFDTLEKYPLPKDLFVAESSMYIFPLTTKEKQNTKLFKKFNITSGIFFQNKLESIKSLMDFKDIIGIEEIVFPEAFVLLDNKVVGYIMELVPSITLEQALSQEEISIERKIKYFYQIGVILEKMDYVRNNTRLTDFYLNDVHENNFIIDIASDTVKVVDIDSSQINKSKTLTIGSKYLQSNAIISNTNKYQQDESFVYGCSIIPNKDTDLYCYIIMILNFLYGGGIEELSQEEIYDYLDYLVKIGIDLKLVNIFKKILSNEPNDNPYKLLETLIPFYGMTHKSIYKNTKNK